MARFSMLSVSLSLLFVTVIKASYYPPQTALLKFKLSARNLIDSDGFSTTDGYVEAFYSNDGGRLVKRLGRTETIFDKRNPDWGKEFEFHFDRKLNQYWFFHLYDEDHFDYDDPIGSVWVNVADYVDKKQVAHSNLDKGGYLTIKDSVEVIENKSKKRKNKEQPKGILPFRHGTPNNKKIRFQVSVRGIPKNVNHHETLVVTLADGVNGAEKDVGKSTFVTGSLNPSWDKVFTVNWNKKKDHRLHFRVYDGHGDKVLKEGDKVGDGWIEVNDYIAKGEIFTVILSPKGALTMIRV